LKQLKPALSSTITLASATTNVDCPDRDIKIYKNSVVAGNLLATITFENTSDGCTVSCSPSGTLTCAASSAYTTVNLAVADTAFTDVDISSGGSVTLIVTADTQDAATGKTLSVSVGADVGTEGTGEVGDSTIWSDSLTSVIDVVDGMPLLPVKTLTY